MLPEYRREEGIPVCAGAAMESVQIFLRKHSVRVGVCAAVLATLLPTVGLAQTKAQTSPDATLQDINKYPGLLPEFGQLFQKIQKEVQAPPERTQSSLLPLLPESTVFYAALPNYGEASHQALKVFQAELQESQVLRDWWQHTDAPKGGPKLEDTVEKFYQLSQYLGDEIVLSGTLEGGKDPNMLVIAEVRKPGLKEWLARTAKDFGDKTKPAARVFDAAELAAAKDAGTPHELVVLVRPDYVVAALDLATLRKFNARLEKNGREFASTPFGQRIAQSYANGVSGLGAVDLQKVLALLPKSTEQNEKMFRQTGFTDVKYLVWEHKKIGEQAGSQVEVSFKGPRRGIASWLASPGPLGSLDFVSAKTMLAVALLLKSPAQIFDDLRELSAVSNPNSFASVDQMERGLNISLRNDLLKRLTGEITFELDNVSEKDADWKVILRVDDPERMQAVLSKLLALAPVQPQYSEEDGVGYHTLVIPSAQKTTEVAYAFVDGYLIVGAGREKVRATVQAHRSGASLAKSPKLQNMLPPGGSTEVSGLFYEDPASFAALNIQKATPGMTAPFLQMSPNAPPAVMWAYGDENAVREVSRSGGADAGVAMIAAAIVIPNLMRARTAANESSALGTLRSAITAEITYKATYPDVGFARDFARLGSDNTGSKNTSPQHAGLVDSTLANPSCTSGAWCTKSGYRFTIKAMCVAQSCMDYVAVATPDSGTTGSRNFCATSDGVVRFQVGEPLKVAPTISECKRWARLP